MKDFDDVVAAIETLDSKARECFDRVFVNEDTYPETASALGIPIGTVRSRIHRARHKLSSALKP